MILAECGDEPSKTDGLSEEREWFYQLASDRTPWLTQDSQSQFLPHELNLPELDAVDFKKGCFMGQEVIARMHYKGKLKSHLQLLTTHSKSPIKAQEAIYCDEKKAGQVICSASLANGSTQVLSILRDSYLNHTNFYITDEKASILNLTLELSG
jgi:folate-binding protein YgfZ